MKKWMIGALIVLVLAAIAWFGLWYPWIKLGETTFWTCSRCGSNKSTTVEFGEFGRRETNRYDTITFRARGFDHCQHSWTPGSSLTNQSMTANQAPEAIGAQAAPQPQR